MSINKSNTILKHASSRHDGFTLVEIVVAITVAGFVIMGLSVMVTSLYVINDKTRDLIAATSAVENKYEDLRTNTYLALPNGTTDFTDELPNSLATPRSASYTVSDSSLANVGGAVKEVSIIVTYNNHGTNEVLEYREYIGELGVGQY